LGRRPLGPSRCRRPAERAGRIAAGIKPGTGLRFADRIRHPAKALVNPPLTTNPAILFDDHSHGRFKAVKRGDGALEALGLPTSSPACHPPPAEAVTSMLVGRTVADVERDLILDTLDHCLGNRTQAARLLGISIRTLRNKLNEYGSAGVAIPQPGQARVALI
jgi:hypothetical protein